ncbi:MAG: nuclear transport factor 2 family protein [Coriobacteriia bacterium]|nr:nuclear transport factor 2 family protein [Coriobacteriia bacterium]
MRKTDKQEILQVINDYMQGNYRADEVLLKSVFHEKAVIHGFFDSELKLSDPDSYIREITGPTSMELNKCSYKLAVEHLYIQGDIASVTVTETGFLGKYRLVDCFHLIKVDGLWSVIARLFTTY